MVNFHKSKIVYASTNEQREVRRWRASGSERLANVVNLRHLHDVSQPASRTALLRPEGLASAVK